MKQLDEVDKACGQCATDFRAAISKKWGDRRWPQTGTAHQKLLDGIFCKLCKGLHATRQHPGANKWSKKKLQEHMTAELVSFLCHLHFHRSAELMFYPL